MKRKCVLDYLGKLSSGYEPVLVLVKQLEGCVRSAHLHLKTQFRYKLYLVGEEWTF